LGGRVLAWWPGGFPKVDLDEGASRTGGVGLPVGGAGGAGAVTTGGGGG
jgi:hypothetical protein